MKVFVKNQKRAWKQFRSLLLVGALAISIQPGPAFAAGETTSEAGLGVGAAFCSLIYGPRGEALKEFHAHDGLGLVLARVAGLSRAVLTGRNSAIVERRATELRFDAMRLGRFDKVAAARSPQNTTAYPWSGTNAPSHASRKASPSGTSRRSPRFLPGAC